MARLSLRLTLACCLFFASFVEAHRWSILWWGYKDNEGRCDIWQPFDGKGQEHHLKATNGEVGRCKNFKKETFTSYRYQLYTHELDPGKNFGSHYDPQYQGLYGNCSIIVWEDKDCSGRIVHQLDKANKPKCDDVMGECGDIKCIGPFNATGENLEAHSVSLVCNGGCMSPLKHKPGQRVCDEPPPPKKPKLFEPPIDGGK